MASQQKTTIKIPRGYTPAQRQAIAEDIIFHIRVRTKRDQRDKDGNRFPRYTKEYAEEKGSTRVNLTESGDMLDALQLLTERSGSITIGYEDGYEGMGKVEGNRLGSYGGDEDPSKARDFLGIEPKELTDILNRYDLDETSSRNENSFESEAAGLSRETLAQMESNLRNNNV